MKFFRAYHDNLHTFIQYFSKLGNEYFNKKIYMCRKDWHASPYSYTDDERIKFSKLIIIKLIIRTSIFCYQILVFFKFINETCTFLDTRAILNILSKLNDMWCIVNLPEHEHKEYSL